MRLERPPFEDLYREFLPRIHAFLRVHLGSAADAEDVTAQVFIKAYEAYDRYEPRGGTPAAWLFRIARNAMLDSIRSRNRRTRLEVVIASQPEPVEDPSEMAVASLDRDLLLAAIATLPDRQREAVTLRHSELGFKEVGDLMGCSEDAAKMLYHRALRSLREKLTGE